MLTLVSVQVNCLFLVYILSTRLQLKEQEDPLSDPHLME